MTEKLQIYKDTYSLVRLLYAAMPQMDKTHRRQIGARIIDSALDMTKWIVMANNTRDKQERLVYMNHLTSSFEALRVCLRLSTDMKLIKLSTLSGIFLLTDNIARQLSGWRAVTTRP